MSLNPDNVILFNDPNLRMKTSQSYDVEHFWEPGGSFTDVQFDQFVFGKDATSGSYYTYIDCKPSYVTNANMVMTIWNLICLPMDGYEFTDIDHIEEVPIEKMILVKGTWPVNIDDYAKPDSRTHIDTDTATGFSDAYVFITYNTKITKLYPTKTSRWEWILKTYSEDSVANYSYYDHSVAEKLSKPVAVLAFTQWTDAVFLNSPFLKMGDGYDYLPNITPDNWTEIDPDDWNNIGHNQLVDRTDQELSPMITPDTTRAALSFLKKFNDNHTNRFKGYEDINGSKYVGTVENFGDEMLIESKKMLMEKPSMKRLFKENTFSEYFNLEYSKLADAYPQHNMLEAILKPNVLNDKFEYTLKLKHCSLEFIYRSIIDGDKEANTYETMKSTKFFTTREVPQLIIRNKETDETDTIELKVQFDEGQSSTSYSFMYDNVTRGYGEAYDNTLPQDYGEEFADISIPLTHKLEQLPIVWVICDSFLSEPNMNDCIVETNRQYLNTLHPDTPFEKLVENCKVKFAVGTTSQGQYYIYPYIYLPPSTDVEALDYFDRRKMFLDMYSDDFDMSRPDSLNGSKITLMRLYFYFSVEDVPDEVSNYIYGFIEYKVNTRLIELTFETPNEYKNDGWSMLIKQPKSYNISGIDSDKYSDVITRTYPCSCHLSMDKNIYQPVSIVDLGRPRLSVRFKATTFPYYGDRGENVSGVHVDAGTDYNNHSVLKDTGIIHNLGEFDGLPKYFNYLKDRDVHRSHVELYSIRGRIDHNNQKTTDKQTAGLILDSAIPQSELKTMIGGDPVIYFKPMDPFTKEPSSYQSDMRKLISVTNALSEITFTDNNTFSNVTDKNVDHSKEPMFIYHGKRNFSLGAMDYDPELERGRIYVVSNDPARYRNNGDGGMPPRTMARICDIPTEYSQLMHVKNVAPTLLSDVKYVKSTASFSLDAANRLWNKLSTIPSITRFDSYNMLSYWIKPPIRPGQSMNVWYRRSELEEEYHTVTGFDNRLTFDKNKITISNRGSRYAVGDTFTIMLGGSPIDGTITEVNTAGNVINFNIEEALIPPSNVTNLETEISMGTVNTSVISVTPSKVKTENGSGLSFIITFTEEDFRNAARKDDNDNLFEGLYTYAYDDIGDIYVWEYDNESRDWTRTTQITGPKVVETIYDKNNKVPTYKRTIENVMLYNLINTNNLISDEVLNASLVSNISITENVLTLKEYYHRLNLDISKYISKEYNVNGAIYLTSNPPQEQNPETGFIDYVDPHKCTLFTFDGFIPSSDNKYINEVMIPKNNKLNSSATMNQTNKFMMDKNNDAYQPDLYLFMPNRKYRVIKDEEYNISHGMFVGEHVVDRLTEILNIRYPVNGMRWLSNNKRPISNVYRYSGYPDISGFDEFSREILTTPADEMNMLYSVYGAKFPMIQNMMERMSPSEFKNYIIINNYYLNNRDAYNKADTSMITKGDEAIPNDVDILSGSIANITAEEINVTLKMPNSSGNVTGMPLYIFEVSADEKITFIPASYRIYDMDGNDITKLSILIENNPDGSFNKWYFNNDEWHMINANAKEV